jgi:hypothetical protein
MFVQKVINVILILDFARDICRASVMIFLPNPYFDILFQDRPGKSKTRVKPDAADNSALSIQEWMKSSQDVSLYRFFLSVNLCGVTSPRSSFNHMLAMNPKSHLPVNK